MMKYLVVWIIVFLCFAGTSKESKIGDFPLHVNFPRAARCKYYVDKTLLIKSFLEDNNRKVFVNAPRNFGKTMNLQMLKCFLEIQVNEEGLEIVNKTTTSNYRLFVESMIYKKYPEFFELHFGQYPVIYVDYNLLSKVSNYRTLLQVMSRVVQNTFSQHEYLTRIKKIWDSTFTLNKFRKLIINKIDLDKELVIIAFDFLAQHLFKHFKKVPIVLIDDYESFVEGVVFNHKGKPGEVYKLLKMFLNINMFMNKTSLGLIDRVFCTGSMHATTDGVLHGYTTLTEYYFAHLHKYSQYYGMSEEELVELLQKSKVGSSKSKQLKTDLCNYYGGYRLQGSRTRMLNIYSVLMYLQNEKNVKNSKNRFRSYWKKRKSFKSTLPLFYSDEVVNDLVVLVQKRSTLMKFTKYWTKNDINHMKFIVNGKLGKKKLDLHSLAFNILLQNGYVAYKNDTGFNFDFRVIRIPNIEMETEVKTLLIRSILERYKLSRKSLDDIYETLNVITEYNCEKSVFKGLFNDLTKFFTQGSYRVDTISYFQDHVFSLLNQGFEVHVDTKKGEDYCRPEFHFKNSHDITLVVGSNMVLYSKEKIPHENMRSCARDELERIIERPLGIYDDCRRSPFVCIVICIGMSKSKKPSKPVFSLSYATNIKNDNGLNISTVFV